MPYSRVKHIIPKPVLPIFRQVRKKLRHMKWRLHTTFNKDIVTKRNIIEQLRSLGVKEGQDLMVHSSLSRIGFVEGGADTVLDALLETIGETATLLLPAYPMKGSMLETMRDTTPFDIGLTPSTMGKITEALRSRNQSIRSAHPTHSIVAMGPKAAMYVKNHHLSRSPCGPQSPFWLLAEYGGAILCLGTGIGKVTSHHIIKDRNDYSPLRVFLPDVYTKSVRLTDGAIIEVDVLVHDPKLSALRMDNNRRLELEFLENMRKAGIVREGMIGNAASYLFSAADLNALHMARRSKGKNIYAPPKGC